MIEFFLKKVSMRIRFILRKSRLNKLGMCPVEYHVRINSIVSTRYSTGVFVAPAKWDPDAQRIRGNSEVAQDGNREIERISYEIKQLYDLNRAKLVFLSSKELTDMYVGKAEIGCTYDQACEKRITFMREKGRSEETVKIHIRHHRYFRAFLKENMEMTLIVKRHVRGFWSHLRNLGYKNDVANKIQMNVKGLFIFAEKEDLIPKNPFTGLGLEWENNQDLTHLTDLELEDIKDAQWSAPIQRVADNFLFMCYTGLHISDYRSLESSNVMYQKNRTWIKIDRVKTGVECIIPIHEEAQRIIDKYGNLDKLPKISGKTTNIYLKAIGEKIGTNKVLTNKVARKTFTDMCLNKYMMSEETVAAILGHSSTKYVKKYGAVRDQRILTEWKQRLEAYDLL